MTFLAKVFIGQALVFATAAGLYLIGAFEFAGLILLGTCVLFGLWLGVWMQRASRNDRRFDYPPSDGPVGSFPTATRWTPILAVAIVILANGVMAGRWLFGIGVGLLIVATVGFAFEYVTAGSPDGDLT